MAKKLLVLGVALVMCLGLFAGCEDAELQLGVYENDSKMAWVALLENNEFKFVRDIAMGYWPMGHYSIEGRKLILHDTVTDEKYTFNIKNGQLVFVSGPGLGILYEAGTKFKLTEKED